MRATVMHGAGDVRVEDVPDARIEEPIDAVIPVTCALICGSDLWPYRSMGPSETGQPMGHEAIGVVAEVNRAMADREALKVMVRP
jgi:threonine dehydrogenase-like Zn-dependent dehydrogenase